MLNRGGCSFTESQNKKSQVYNHQNKKSINNNKKIAKITRTRQLSLNHNHKLHQITNVKRCPITVTKYSLHPSYKGRLKLIMHHFPPTLANPPDPSTYIFLIPFPNVLQIFKKPRLISSQLRSRVTHIEWELE